MACRGEPVAPSRGLTLAASQGAARSWAPAACLRSGVQPAQHRARSGRGGPCPNGRVLAAGAGRSARPALAARVLTPRAASPLPSPPPPSWPQAGPRQATSRTGTQFAAWRLSQSSCPTAAVPARGFSPNIPALTVGLQHGNDDGVVHSLEHRIQSRDGFPVGHRTAHCPRRPGAVRLQACSPDLQGGRVVQLLRDSAARASQLPSHAASTSASERPPPPRHATSVSGPFGRCGRGGDLHAAPPGRQPAASCRGSARVGGLRPRGCTTRPAGTRGLSQVGHRSDPWACSAGSLGGVHGGGAFSNRGRRGWHCRARRCCCLWRHTDCVGEDTFALSQRAAGARRGSCPGAAIAAPCAGGRRLVSPAGARGQGFAVEAVRAA